MGGKEGKVGKEGGLLEGGGKCKGGRGQMKMDGTGWEGTSSLGPATATCNCNCNCNEMLGERDLEETEALS